MDHGDQAYASSSSWDHLNSTGYLMRAMATQVEVGSTLSSLTTRSELTSEARLQCPFASSLSDASHKPGQLPSSLSPLVLEERSKFGSPLRPATMPPAASRARLTPKPFSREKSSDTFSVVKPPVPVFRPSNVAPSLPVFAKTMEDVTVAKGLTGNVPPLVDQKSIEDKSPSELVANMPFDSSPQANTVILFETGKSEKGKMKFTPEKSLLGSPQIRSTFQAPEGHLPTSESGMFCGRTGIHRQLSLSSEPRPISWNPCVSLERKDPLVCASEEKGKVTERQYSAGVSTADEVQLRPKQRPVSAIFLESLKDQKQCCLEVSDEKSLPEKTWVRKPRPLSMDLTAKFENRDLSLQRKSCPTESTEKNLGTDPTTQGSSVRPSEMGTRDQGGASDGADPSKPSLKSPGPLADFSSVLNPKPFPSEEAPWCQSAQKDFPHVSARDRKCLWESRLKRHDEQNASEMETEATPEKVTEPSSAKGQSIKERAAKESPKELCSAGKNSAYGADTAHQSLRYVEKPLSVPDRSANGATSVNAGSQLESPGEQNRIVNIQQRIKELTTENTEAKPGNRRRMFRSRPLSADLTKLFSSPAISSDLKSEKLAELNRKPASKTPESQEITANPLLETDPGEAHAGGVLWRPQQPVKILHLQRDGGFARERHGGALPCDSPASVAGHDMHADSTSPAEKACIKTVRATMFEHHVHRHQVATDYLGVEPLAQRTNELSGNCRELWVGKAAESKMFSKEAPSRQLDISVDAEKPGKANSLNKVRVLQDTTWKKYVTMEKWENPTTKNMEDSLACQRIEPRYEILQTVGKRAQSEAITPVCEDKAVTLRSRRSLKERRKSGENFVDAAWSRSLDLQGGCWSEDSFVSKTKEGGEMTAKAEAEQVPNASLGQRPFCEQVKEWDKNQVGQKHAAAKASYSTNRNKDVGVTDNRVSVVPSELEKEESKGKTEGTKVPKHLPEDFGAGPSRRVGAEAVANVVQRAASGSPNEPETHLPGIGGSQWPTVSSKVPHHGADVRTYEQEEPKGSGFGEKPSAPCGQETSDAAGRRPEGHQFQHLETEEQVKRSSRRASAGRVSERWRRKTLPHDIRFEDGGTLAEEDGTVLIRRDSLPFHEGSIAKKSRKPRGAAEPKEGTSASPSSLEDRFKGQPSPSKPKATYFAVTYQIPNEVEGHADKEFTSHKSRWFPSLAENTLFASDAGAPRRSLPSSDRQSCTAVSDMPGSLDRPFGQNLEEAGEGDTSPLLKKGAVKYPEGREESWRSLGRQVEDAKDGVLGVDPHLDTVGLSSPGEQKSPSYLRHFHQDGEWPGQKKRSDYSYSVPKEKTADSYRSRVLDIDALMAEYKEDSLKPPLTQDRREGEDSSLFPWEKSRRSSLDKASFSYSRKDPQALDDSPGSPWPAVHSMEVRRPENVCVSERERVGSQEPHSVPQRDGEFSPPPRGRPSALGLPANVPSAKKKTFILDEELEASLVTWSQGAEYRDPLCLDSKAEAGFAPHPSSILPAGTCPKQQVTCGPPESDGPNARSLSKRRSSGAGSPRQSSPSVTQSRAERKTSALANTSPEVKPLSSEKTPQAKAKVGLPVGPEARERRHQQKVRQSFPPEQAGHVRQSRRSASQQRPLFCEKKKDLEKERSRPDTESPGARSSPHLASQQKSRGFYRDRRVDHWAADQLKQCFGRPVAEAKDTDSLVREADSQYGTWSEQRHSGDSLAPESPSSESNVASARRQPPSSRPSSFSSQTDPASTTDPHDSSRDQRSASLDRSSTDVESADGAEGPAPPEACPDFSFPEQTAVLDSSALKTRVQLSKRRRQQRAPISHLLRRSTGGGPEQQPSVAEEAGSAWMFKDSSEKSAKPEDLEEEEEEEEEEGKLPSSERPPVSQSPQRLPVFPGLDPSALKAKLRRRQEPEGAGDASPGQLSRSPKSMFQLGGPAVRVLPAGTEKEERLEEASPSLKWLKGLKSKKRQNPSENQV